MSYPLCSGDAVAPSSLDAFISSPGLVGDGSQTDFALADAEGIPIEQVEVTVDGLTQQPTVGATTGDFTIEDDSPDLIVRFTTAPPSGAQIFLRAYR